MSDNNVAKPQAHAAIPSGIGTKLGLVGSCALAVATVLTTVLQGNHTDDTTLFAVLGTVVAVITVAGRMAQAVAAILKGEPNPEPPPEISTPASSPTSDRSGDDGEESRDPALEPGQ